MKLSKTLEGKVYLEHQKLKTRDRDSIQFEFTESYLRKLDRENKKNYGADGS